jgi:hypothetical protein
MECAGGALAVRVSDRASDLGYLYRSRLSEEKFRYE